MNAREGNYSQSTPLHWAAAGGHLEVTQLLISKGAKLDIADNWNNLTPIGWATMLHYDHGDCPMGSDHREVREFLLVKGAKFDVFSAIALNDFQQVSSLIAANPDTVNQRLGFALDELQPLHYAIQENKTEIAKLLIQQGADLQAQTRFGVTPLCMAIDLDNQEIVKLLISKNVPEDLSVLLVSKQWSEAEIIARSPNLLTEKALLLHYTIKQGLFEATFWLIKKGVDIELRTNYLLDNYVTNLTPLQVAVEAKQLEIAELLIKSGAEVNAQTTGEIKFTALHDAAADGYLDLIRLLVKHQADLNAKDNIDDATPLDWAKEFEQEAAVELLKQLSTAK